MLIHLKSEIWLIRNLCRSKAVSLYGFVVGWQMDLPIWGGGVFGAVLLPCSWQPFDHAIAGRNVLCFVLCRINAVRKLVGMTLSLS